MSEKTLTDVELISYLLSLEYQKERQKMKGRIRPVSRQRKCPKCGTKFKEIAKIGYICVNCKTIPTKFVIDIHWKGQRVYICSDKTGQALDSYQRALNLLSHINYEIRTHVFDPSKYIASDLKKYLFENLIDRWFEDKKEKAKKGLLSWAYLNPVKGYIKNYLKPFFTGKDVRDIRSIDVKEFFKQLPNNLAPKTQKNILDTLHNFFNSLVEDEIIEKKPIFPKIHVPEPEIKWCSREMQDKILQAIPQKHRFLYFFLMRQGLRPGEAIALKWEDIDLQNGILTVKRTVSNRKIVERTKSKKFRPRLLHPEVLEILRSMPRGLPHTFLFINPNTGRPYGIDTVQRIWRKTVSKLGISITLYQATRHSVASMAAISGVPIQIIKEVLGHTDIRTTQKYAHLDVLAQNQVFEAQNQNREQSVNKNIFSIKK